MRCLVFSIPHRLLVIGVILFGAGGADGAIANFDDLTLPTESYWSGPDPNGTNITDIYGDTIRVGSFQSGNVEFVNRRNLTHNGWSGFAYSNTTDTTTPGLTNQYSAYTGSGYGPGDNNYGVAYGNVENLDPSDVNQLQQLPYFELPDGTSIESLRVTNTTYAVLSMLNGDAFAKKFGGASGDDPDWFKLTAYGTNALGGLLPNTVEFFLADYQFSNNSLDYIIDEWTLVDLSPLADAKCLYFNLTSSDVGAYGMNTPAFFAIDNDNSESTFLPGDANLDGRVDDIDATILAANWLTPATATWGHGDFDASGTVDQDDLDLMAANWQKTTLDILASASTSTSSVPEPAGFVMLLIGGVCTALIPFLRQ